MQKHCLFLFFAAGVAAVGLGTDPASATGTAAPIAAEVIGGEELRTLCPADIGYNPNWAQRSGVPGGKAVIRLVEHPDTDYAVTTVLNEGDVDEIGTYLLTIGDTGERNVRLTHTTEVDGEAVGDVLSADVAFGKVSAASSAFFAATATNALQMIADAKGVAPLAYSTAWTNGVTKVKIDYAYEQLKKGRKYGEGAGTLLSADADATGVFDYDLSEAVGGDYTLTYTMYGENDEVLDTYTALFSLPFKLGLMLMVR